MPEIKQLNENLKRQAALYEELKMFAEYKQQALVNNNLHEIEAATVREEQLIMEASRLEKERLLWAEQIAREIGKAPENITLSELAERFPELTGVKTELDNVLTNLRQVNELNTQLLKQAIKVIDLTLGLMTAQPNGSTYVRPGGKENEPKSNVHFLDRSI
ncbi:FlgN protein [Desulfitobacterium dichloroeliminans LMG P-21439]|uniref:FlgN protein n=1 Tax=Desulfitobacterium dichloroeliminans (strain LMG P-21439 / DCA1) TaxID=871963 RepID=L0FAR7_DESDL|nr:flagellar protein FlgN [Desulfitobacterium dichloroeliminans]AGA70322.1 FlgN protein [Desulfitobacterium dichloroeliminans LMG P-21439]